MARRTQIRILPTGLAERVAGIRFQTAKPIRAVVVTALVRAAAAWAGSASAAETFREAPRGTAVPLGMAGLGGAAPPELVAPEVLPAWEAAALVVGAVVCEAAVCEAAAEGSRSNVDKE